MTTSHTHSVAKLAERNIGRLRDRLADAGLTDLGTRTRVAIYNAMAVRCIPGLDRTIEAYVPATIDGIHPHQLRAAAPDCLTAAIDIDVHDVGLTPHHTTGGQIYAIDDLTYRLRW